MQKQQGQGEAVCWEQRLEDATLLPLKMDRGPGTKEIRQPLEAVTLSFLMLVLVICGHFVVFQTIHL